MGSLGKDAATAGERVVLAVNGVRREAAGVDPSTTLLEFLRTRTPVRGPKLGCGEGGCGACVVLISKYDPATDEVTEFSASSCLTLVGSLNHCSVTTSEGIGNTRDGYHPVQKRLAGFHASQCGFCTPGMCMSIFSALVKADKTGDPAPPLGFSKLTCSEAEHAVSGNLCAAPATGPSSTRARASPPTSTLRISASTHSGRKAPTLPTSTSCQNTPAAPSAPSLSFSSPRSRVK
ncbi:unnamed protein product [Triticum turgidum subsp. durum]|uniref:2Fe-2S ferredoxin-type domain-containing protein n=1 Tax=Triticum turgidum subsp. durum TaxID=4567 RepID=A0A9R0U4E4_TRITD|nr:unnamed protein product [Triticum turgidum subsp. durum]